MDMVTGGHLSRPEDTDELQEAQWDVSKLKLMPCVINGFPDTSDHIFVRSPDPPLSVTPNAHTHPILLEVHTSLNPSSATQMQFGQAHKKTIVEELWRSLRVDACARKDGQW